jgi:Leucine-rich repeat (LRR) protein
MSIACIFNITQWDHGTSLFTCHVNNIKNTEDSDTKVSIINDPPETNMMNQIVQGFIIKKSPQLKHMPLELDKCLPNLTAIEISHTELSQIRYDDLKSFTNLVILRLYANHLRVIESGLFRHNKHLQIVWLNHNKIHYIDEFVFSDLIHLRELNLADNNCRRSFFNGQGGDHIKHLVHQIEAGQCSSFYDNFQLFERTLMKDVGELKDQVKKYHISNRLLFMIILGVIIFVGVVISIVAAVIIKLNL